MAYCLLNIDIQGETHDSTEDARTALALYNKYIELSRENKFQQTLQRIYEIGRQNKWSISVEIQNIDV